MSTFKWKLIHKGHGKKLRLGWKVSVRTLQAVQPFDGVLSATEAHFVPLTTFYVRVTLETPDIS